MEGKTRQSEAFFLIERMLLSFLRLILAREFAEKRVCEVVGMRFRAKVLNAIANVRNANTTTNSELPI